MTAPLTALKPSKGRTGGLLGALVCLFVLLGCACESTPRLSPLAQDAARPLPIVTPVHAQRFGLEDAGSPEDAQRPTVRRGPPYPVVLVHGFSGFNRLGPLEYFFGVLDDLASEGETQVFAPALPPYNSIEARAPYLAQAIDEVLAATSATKVHIIAHSQGGLDARHVISSLGYADRVATLTTVATPHHGTPLADYVLDLPEDSLNPVARTLAWLIGSLDSPDARPDDPQDTSWRNDMDASAQSLSTEAMRAYNRDHPDDARVPIFSIAAVSNMQFADSICEHSQWGELHRVDVIDPLLMTTATVLSGWNPFDRTPNDGIVPTFSMVWGRFIGCVPADHFDEVGQIADLTPHIISGFDHLRFYRQLMAHLREWERQQTERP